LLLTEKNFFRIRRLIFLLFTSKSMATENPNATVQEAAKQPSSLRNAVRIILFAGLAVAIVALVVDQMARRASSAAFQALDAKLGLDHERTDVSRDEVHKIVGRAPDADGNPDDPFEVYTWRGVRPQSLYVIYRQGVDNALLLSDVSLNDPPARFNQK
jgi:hypothetical protein